MSRMWAVGVGWWLGRFWPGLHSRPGLSGWTLAAEQEPSARPSSKSHPHVSVIGVDPSEGYISFAREHIRDARVHFTLGDAQALPVASASYDAVVAGLVLNFVPHPSRAVAEMVRVAQAGGTVAAYIWDYAGQMQLMRSFWDAAVALDPAAIELDEERRFPLCQPEPLMHLFQAAGLQEVEVRPIDIPTTFRDFDDYWSPFLGGQGPAPGYAMSLSEEQRARLRERLRATLPPAPDGSITLIARTWAVQGVCDHRSTDPGVRILV